MSNPFARSTCSRARAIRRLEPAFGLPSTFVGACLGLFFALSIGVCFGVVALGIGARPASARDVGSLPRFALPGLPESAQAVGVVDEGGPQLRATLLVRDSAPARIGLYFELAPGWHLYWRNPGETGVAPEIALDVNGRRAGALDWPAPEVFREADDLFTTYGYERNVLLSAALPTSSGSDVPRDEKPMARAQASVLVCRTQCVPASFDLQWPLDTRLEPGATAAIDAIFRDGENALPRPASTFGWKLDAAWPAAAPAVDQSDRIALSLDACGSNAKDCPFAGAAKVDATFIPFESETFEFGGKQQVSVDSSTGRIELDVETTRLEAGADRLRGLVALRPPDGVVLYGEIDVPIRSTGDARAKTAAATATTAAMASNPGDGGASANGAAIGSNANGAAAAAAPIASADWIRAFLLALLGGVILNGMPCVLPVLAIKVVSVADLAARDPREVRMHGLAYTAGVLGSMALLASLVLGLRFAGHAVGWGFQFQEPLFVAGIAALLVTFALNLFGVFEIELGQGRLAAVGQDASGVSRSVFEGLLAVVLATPCTAPFLGTAVGFAFASSGYGIVAIFLAIGIGLASPFLLVSFFPRLARFIPRSGPWMLKLRAGLGFCLLATVVWLLWIVGQSGGTNGVIALVAALLFLGFLLWVFGQLQPIESAWLGRASVAGIALLAFTGFNLIEFEPAAAAPGASATVAAEDGFQPYSESAVREALAAGRPAFVVFTADWCITCKVNESTVLDRPAVQQALESGGYARFRADWTRRDEAIRTKLAQFGRAGVPLYLVYDPAKPDEPRVLSELLTQDAVVTALADPGRPARS